MSIKNLAKNTLLPIVIGFSILSGFASYVNYNLTPKVNAVGGPSVTINQKSTQTDPTPSSNITFVAVFSKPIDVSTFTAADVVLSGTATGASVTAITQVAPNDGTTFEITATATSYGTIIASIPAAVMSSFTTLGTTGKFPNYMVMDKDSNIYTHSANN